MTFGSDFPGTGARTFRPRPELLVIVLVAALAAATWAVFASGSLDRLVAAFLSIAAVTVAVVGWRRRLTVGPRGLLISGIGGSRIVPWSDVVGVHSATSSRLGLTSSTIEIDLVDDDLLVFGRTDLGADLDDVLTVLQSRQRG